MHNTNNYLWKNKKGKKFRTPLKCWKIGDKAAAQTIIGTQKMCSGNKKKQKKTKKNCNEATLKIEQKVLEVVLLDKLKAQKIHNNENFLSSIWNFNFEKIYQSSLINQKVWKVWEAGGS